MVGGSSPSRGAISTQKGHNQCPFFAQGLRPDILLWSRNGPEHDLSLSKVLSRGKGLLTDSFLWEVTIPEWMYILRLKSGQLYVGSTAAREYLFRFLPFPARRSTCAGGSIFRVGLFNSPVASGQPLQRFGNPFGGCLLEAGPGVSGQKWMTRQQKRPRERTQFLMSRGPALRQDQRDSQCFR